MSIRDRYIKALTDQGERQVQYPSDKYVVFTRAQGGHYFIGKSGALRFGATIKGSMPVSSAGKAKLLGSRANTMGADKANAFDRAARKVYASSAKSVFGEDND